jgi:molybdopterin-guanine dinucleotide biosynthesis protein A
MAWPVSFSAGLALVYDRGMAEVSAFVLAGGRSSRMGTDKAFVEFQGRMLLDRALSLVTAITPKVYILGNRAVFGAFGDVVEDQFPDHGPLGGIHAALRTSASDLNVILAVDMPFVQERFLKYLVSEAEKCSAQATVPRAAGNWQPLCAVYRKAFADLAEPALRSGHNKIDPLFREAPVRVIAEDELEGAGFAPELFRNLNTPEDLLAARDAVQAQNREPRTEN